MKITVIGVGKIKEKYFTDAIKEYSKRLSRFTQLEIVEINDEKIPENASEKEMEKIKEKEGKGILSKIKDGAYIVALCIEGKENSSEELAKKIEEISMQSSHIVFVIGGSLGLSDEVKNAASLRLSFGRMTLPHQLMRVVLLEQIYRAYKINNNESYHK